jgi:hypothetical protein
LALSGTSIQHSEQRSRYPGSNKVDVIRSSVNADSRCGGVKGRMCRGGERRDRG